MGNTENMLAVTPLPTPTNAFAQVAREMRAGKYPNAEAAEKALESAKWLEFLASKPIPCDTREPVLIMALARIACDGDERARFEAVIGLVDKYADEVRNGTPSGASRSNGGGGGFSIDGDTVVSP